MMAPEAFFILPFKRRSTRYAEGPAPLDIDAEHDWKSSVFHCAPRDRSRQPGIVAMMSLQTISFFSARDKPRPRMHWSARFAAAIKGAPAELSVKRLKRSARVRTRRSHQNQRVVRLWYARAGCYPPPMPPCSVTAPLLPLKIETIAPPLLASFAANSRTSSGVPTPTFYRARNYTLG